MKNSTKKNPNQIFQPFSQKKSGIENRSRSKDIIVTYSKDHYINNEVQTYECTSLIEVKASQSLLDAMNEHHIQVMSSCKNGTCGTCWALKTDGKVRMVNNHALTEQDISDGIILLCQSYPKDEKVVISLS